MSSRFVLNDSLDVAFDLHYDATRVLKDDGVPCVLVGNKADLEDKRVISRMYGSGLAGDWLAAYIETSTKTCHNVDMAFMQLLREIKKYRRELAQREELKREMRKFYKSQRRCQIL